MWAPQSHISVHLSVSDTRTSRTPEVPCLWSQFSGTPSPLWSQSDSKKVECKGLNMQALATRVSTLYMNWKNILKQSIFTLCYFHVFFFGKSIPIIGFLLRTRKMRDCLGLGLTLAASVKGTQRSMTRPLPTFGKFSASPGHPEILHPWLPLHVPLLDVFHFVPGSSPFSDLSVEHCKSAAPAPHPPHSSLTTFNPCALYPSLSPVLSVLTWPCGFGKEGDWLPLLLPLP